MPSFLPGRELAARFYVEAVRPILDASFPNLPHAAALIGSGSEVLGFDTPVSADHPDSSALFPCPVFAEYSLKDIIGDHLKLMLDMRKT